MSKAEELADALMMQAKTLQLAGQNDAAVTDIETSAAELRRLAALEKAIMDAEPVAWIYWHPSNDTFCGPSTIHKKGVSRFSDDTRLTMQRDGWKFEHLYTLNGIKP